MSHLVALHASSKRWKGSSTALEERTNLKPQRAAGHHVLDVWQHCKATTQVKGHLMLKPLIKILISVRLHMNGIELFALRYEEEISWSFIINRCLQKSLSHCCTSQYNIYPNRAFDNLSNRNSFQSPVLAGVYQAKESVHWWKKSMFN